MIRRFNIFYNTLPVYYQHAETRITQINSATETDKVRTIARLIYIRTSLVIGLNVVYLLIFNNDSATHVSARECACNNGRGIS